MIYTFACEIVRICALFHYEMHLKSLVLTFYTRLPPQTLETHPFAF
jgi:hypothetical protein